MFDKGEHVFLKEDLVKTKQPVAEVATHFSIFAVAPPISSADAYVPVAADVEQAGNDSHGRRHDRPDY